MFQSMAEVLFRDMSYVKVYVDDVVVGSKDMAEHLDYLEIDLKRIWESGMKRKLHKFVFSRKRIEVLGYVVNEHGV